MREGCRQLPPSNVAYLGPMPCGAGKLDRLGRLSDYVHRMIYTILFIAGHLQTCSRFIRRCAAWSHRKIGVGPLLQLTFHLGNTSRTTSCIHPAFSPRYALSPLSPLQSSSPSSTKSPINLHRLSTRHRDDYANPPATGYSLVGEHIRHRYQQHMDFIAEAVGEVWSVYSLSQFSISIN